MRILLSAHVFPPSVGGIENVAVMLAGEFVRQGHAVRVITQTPGGDVAGLPCEVVRQPSWTGMLRLLAWCEVCLHVNLSLRTAWPLLLVPRPWVVSHHVWIPRDGLAGRLKRLVLHSARGIAASRALARDFDTPSVVVPNPFDDRLFRQLDGILRDRNVVFLGRLVSDKGADTLLEALAVARDAGRRLLATVIGAGPELSALRRQVQQRGLGDQVEFTGALKGPELVAMLNRHHCIAIPSRWQEPFGLVALEGMACGCLPLVARSGGLPEAAGEVGASFPIGDADMLAGLLIRFADHPEQVAQHMARAPAHLARHRLEAVAAGYLEVMQLSLAARSATSRVGHV